MDLSFLLRREKSILSMQCRCDPSIEYFFNTKSYICSEIGYKEKNNFKMQKRFSCLKQCIMNTNIFTAGVDNLNFD